MDPSHYGYQKPGTQMVAWVMANFFPIPWKDKAGEDAENLKNNPILNPFLHGSNPMYGQSHKDPIMNIWKILFTRHPWVNLWKITMMLTTHELSMAMLAIVTSPDSSNFKKSAQLGEITIFCDFFE